MSASPAPRGGTPASPVALLDPKKGWRDFQRLVGAQFFGAFNDNLFKQLILFLAASVLFPGEDKQGLAFAVFALPFVLFSGVAGDLSERHSKTVIVIWAKVAEIGIMLAGVAAFATQSWIAMLVVLFVMGLQSAYFGPPKYGIIPELVEPERLLRANGTIAMTTFLAVLLGQALAGPLLDFFGDRLWIPGMWCTGFAIVGTLCTWGMTRLPALRPELTLARVAGIPNPFGHLGETIRELRSTRGLFSLVIVYSLFWFNGGVLQQAIVGLGEPGYLDVGVGEKSLLSFVMVTLAVSIMAGSLVAPRLATFIAAPRLVMFGAAAMLAGQGALLLIGPVVSRADGSLLLTHVILAVVGFCGAFFVVPLQTHFQSAPPPGQRGQTWAVNNFMNFISIFVGGVYYLVARMPALDIGPGVAQALAGVVFFAAVLHSREHVQSLATSLGDQRG